MQLECVELRYFPLSGSVARNNALYKDYLPNIEKQSWVQQLVPLVQPLNEFKTTGWYRWEERDLMLAAQTYLESKMETASKKVRGTQTVLES